MKLLAVSLVAAASASSNYTAVYGVQPRREHAPRRRDRRPHALRPREVLTRRREGLFGVTPMASKGASPGAPPVSGPSRRRRDRRWFVGWPGSTFSNQITLSRHYALGTNASNYYYNARGVFPRLDDGRLIRDAYDRRERPGKKRRGPESPADWRRVPRRRPAAAA